MPDTSGTQKSSIPWFDDFEGVAYRYYDLRMNIIPLISEIKEASRIWYDTIHWWADPYIRVRFVDAGNRYWFVMGADSKKPENNMSFYKLLPKSENYERFKKGHGGEAYLRLGVYIKESLDGAKKSAACNCGHRAEDHDEGDGDACLYYECDCKEFSSFQVNLFKRKKTITDIAFLDERDVKGDPLAWNCLYTNKYSQD
ncbi:MAG: hypothetical protein D9C04_01090 [Nitrosopumilus sp. B06]|nr:MAG: hypothetical protein D9C04_01090 [Nitrosopumilus sp. B06]